MFQWQGDHYLVLAISEMMKDRSCLDLGFSLSSAQWQKGTGATSVNSEHLSAGPFFDRIFPVSSMLQKQTQVLVCSYNSTQAN